MLFLYTQHVFSCVVFVISYLLTQKKNPYIITQKEQLTGNILVFTVAFTGVTLMSVYLFILLHFYSQP